MSVLTLMSALALSALAVMLDCMLTFLLAVTFLCLLQSKYALGISASVSSSDLDCIVAAATSRPCSDCRVDFHNNNFILYLYNVIATFSSHNIAYIS